MGLLYIYRRPIDRDGERGGSVHRCVCLFFRCNGKRFDAVVCADVCCPPRSTIPQTARIIKMLTDKSVRCEREKKQTNSDVWNYYLYIIHDTVARNQQYCHNATCIVRKFLKPSTRFNIEETVNNMDGMRRTQSPARKL